MHGYSSITKKGTPLIFLSGTERLLRFLDSSWAWVWTNLRAGGPSLPPPRWRMGGKSATAGFCPKITAHVRAPCQLGASKWTRHLEGKGEKWKEGKVRNAGNTNQAIPDTTELTSNYFLFSLHLSWDDDHWSYHECSYKKTVWTKQGGAAVFSVSLTRGHIWYFIPVKMIITPWM